MRNEDFRENRIKFLQDISFKEEKDEKILIDKIRNNPEYLKNLNIDELEKLNKVIANWRKHLAEKIQIIKNKIKN